MFKHRYSYSIYAKIIHLGIAVFGITAFLTGELADGGGASQGYLLHAYLGLSLTTFMVLRIITGLSASKAMSFKEWAPFSRLQWRHTLEDIRTLLGLGIPNRDRHQGLAGLTQAFGLIIFTWMAFTGTGLFLLEGTESGSFEFIEEVHEVGESLIPLYLVLHIGAVILHTVSGNPIWKKMFNLRAN